MKVLLFNLFNNLILCRSKKHIFIVLIALYIVLRIHSKKKQKLKELEKRKKIYIKNNVLITFSGGGQLSFYYQGICAYLKDNFDLNNVRFAGISAGSAAAAALASNLPTEALMIFGLRWFKMIANRPLKLFLIPTSTFVNAGETICKQFGITDEFIKQQSEQFSYI